MQILFDAMGAQVQVQQATGNRLNTWFNSLTSLGHQYAISDYTQPIGPQLANVDVYVTLTRQQASPSNIPTGTDFSYTPEDLGALQTFFFNGGGVLMFTNHSQALGVGPHWPIYEVQLAASLGIALAFASFVPTGSSPSVPNPCQGGPTPTLSMPPNSGAPAELVQGVSTVQAWDSGGILTDWGIPVIPLPSASDCADTSGLEFSPDACSFAAYYGFGLGKAIVAGHSGIAGDDGTCSPSAGQIGYADNLTFLNNCITFLGS